MFNALKKFLRILGPGIITGAADDDPSGIATYSQTGVQFGYGQLWTALFMLPLLAGVQEACSRIGVVTGKGIAAVVREHFSKNATIMGQYRSGWLSNLLVWLTFLGMGAAAVAMFATLGH